MATNILVRIRQLVAMTASPNENEARNAAYQACRLLREHGVELSLPKALATTQAKAPAPKSKVTQTTVVTVQNGTRSTSTHVEVEGDLDVNGFNFEAFIDPELWKR